MTLQPESPSLEIIIPPRFEDSYETFENIPMYKKKSYSARNVILTWLYLSFLSADLVLDY